jgi:hypothetical protein
MRREYASSLTQAGRTIEARIKWKSITRGRSSLFKFRIALIGANRLVKSLAVIQNPRPLRSGVPEASDTMELTRES